MRVRRFLMLIDIKAGIKTEDGGQDSGSALFAQQAVSTLLHTFILHYLTLVRQVSGPPVTPTPWGQGQSFLVGSEDGQDGPMS